MSFRKIICGRMKLQLILLCALMQLVFMDTQIHMADTIMDDTQFYYKPLSVFPSLKAEIQFSIQMDTRCCLPAFPIMDIHTTNNLARNCSWDNFGQLRNERMHLNMFAHHHKHVQCIHPEGSKSTLTCEGRISVQDFKPRHYAVSFGFGCYRFYNANKTLRGLHFNMSLVQSNGTGCFQLSHMVGRNVCLKYITHTSLPNLVGSIPSELRSIINSVNHLKTLFSLAPVSFLKCHQHFEKIACFIAFPQCDPVSNQVTHICKELCFDVVEACEKSWVRLKKLIKSDKKYSFFQRTNTRCVSEVGKHCVDCDYLPSLHSKIPCLYQPVFCKEPPRVANAKQQQYQGKKQHKVHSVVVYSCASGHYKLVGNDTVTCLFSGQWSQPPECILLPQSPAAITVTILGSFMCFFLCFLVGHVCKDKFCGGRTKILQKTFDAFVCYKFDREHEFVRDVLIFELEENSDPPYKLLIESRDFVPGLQIEEDIQNAIQNSCCAIFLISQAFVDSPWCQLEFDCCNTQSVQNPNFGVFVILMEPRENLKNVRPSMKNYFNTRTYLKKEDKRLLTKLKEKLASYRMQQPGNDVVENESLL